MAKHSSGILGSLGFVKTPGAPVPHRKHTSACETVDLPVPAEVTIVMSQHIGAPCAPCVKAKDQVYVGTMVGSMTGMSAPIHSSVSGIVKKVDSVLMPNGSKTQAVIIDSDGQQTLDPSIAPPTVNSREEFIEAVKNSGLVGLGGAGFPAHVKYNTKDKIDYLCVNGAECEPYITADLREMLEDTDNILDGVCAVMKYVGIDKAVIGIEDNKPEAISLMKEKTSGMDNISVLTLPSRYPQGAEKVLIEQCTGRQVPPGKLPSDVGCIVMNVGSAGFLGGYLKTGIPLVTKRVTVDGSAITEPKNVRVPIGTPIKDIIAFCGGYKVTPAKLMCGGPMMGTALMSDEFPVLKQNNAFLAFDESEAKSYEPTACISCGRCVNACPMNLMPTKLESAVVYKRIDDLKKYSVNTCMECGCCSYVCPANRKLVQSMKIGKVLLRNAGN